MVNDDDQQLICGILVVCTALKSDHPGRAGAPLACVAHTNLLVTTNAPLAVSGDAESAKVRIVYVVGQPGGSRPAGSHHHFQQRQAAIIELASSCQGRLDPKWDEDTH